jgi:hypothetical protein
MKALLQAEDRDGSAFGFDASIDFRDGERAWRSNVELWQELGGTHLSLRAMDAHAEFVGEKHTGFNGPQSYIDALEQFAKAVG